MVKTACSGRDLDLIPGSGRFPWRRALDTHSSILAWNISWTGESMGSQRVRYKRATSTFTFAVWTLLQDLIREVIIQTVISK